MKTLFVITIMASFVILGCRNRRDGDSSVKIVNGKLLTPQTAGYFSAASLLIKNPDNDSYIQYCSGVLVDSNTLVTSANCQSKTPSTFVKVDDKPDFSNVNEKSQSHRHPLYNEKYYYDIAWMKLSKPTNITQDKIVPLLKDKTVLQNPSSIESAIVVGGGVFGTSDAGKRFFTEVTVESFMDNELGRGMITAKSNDGSVCFGDNGGPLFVKSKGTWYLAGVLHGYVNASTFDRSQFAQNSEGDLPMESSDCQNATSLLFTYISSHDNWLVQSTTSDVPDSTEFTFNTNETHGDDFMAWCNATNKSDLAWVSVRLALDTIKANTCEDVSKTLSESNSLSLELGSVGMAHQQVLSALMTYASDKVETLELKQYYNDKHDLESFISLSGKFAKLRTLKIENYIGYRSYNFIKALSPEFRDRIETFHFLPSVNPAAENEIVTKTAEETLLLTQFKNLTELNLSYNGLQTLDFLSQLKKLQVLNLDFNQVKNYQPILSVKTLKELSMVSNPVNSTKLREDVTKQLPNVKLNIGAGP